LKHHETRHLAAGAFTLRVMCDLYSITTNQAAIIALFRVVNRYVGNLAPMPGVFQDFQHQSFAYVNPLTSTAD
jgi:hypothetical protein